jgi:dihydrofolate reductase
VAKLVYSAIASLDGYVADGDGDFGWAVPDEEVHAFINDLQRPIGTHLYGRRMYETMAGWETDPALADQSPLMRDFAAPWQAADKIVYSRTLEAAPTARTRIERNFDPEAVRQMKASAGQDMLIGGPNIAAQAFGAGLVDECHLFVTPVVVGAVNGSSPVTSAWSSSCWASAASPTAWFTYATVPRPEATAPPPAPTARAFRGPILFTGVRGREILRTSY